MEKKIAIFVYNRLFDPLVQSNFWPFIQNLLEDPECPYEFCVVTYENSEFPLTEEQQQVVDKWERLGLKWKKRTWHKGRSLRSKLSDVWQGFTAVFALRIKGYKSVISLASVAGTFVYLYWIILRFNFFLYSYEPHSEYSLDNNIWDRKSWQFRISNYLEKRSAFSARVISSGTMFMQERLLTEWKVRADFFKIPSLCNCEKFNFSAADREKIRKELGLKEEDHLLFYPGKFGDLYYEQEIPMTFRWLSTEIKDLHFLIVTPNDLNEIRELFLSAGVSIDKFTILQSDYSKISKYFSAADFAVVAVPPGPSKKFVSNIKVGEYLCSGLPFLITEGVSEDYIYAQQKNVGVVVSSFEEEPVRAKSEEISKYLSEDKDVLRKRCRDFGLEYRGFEKLNEQFISAVRRLTNRSLYS